MSLTDDQVTAIRAFVPNIFIGAACYAVVIAVSLAFRPSRRYRVRLIGMLVVVAIWYGFYLPEFSDVAGARPWTKWVEPGGGGPSVFGSRLSVHTIWAWVIATVLSRPRRSHENAA